MNGNFSGYLTGQGIKRHTLLHIPIVPSSVSTRKNGVGNGWEERGEELGNKDMMWSSKWTKVSSCLESSYTGLYILLCCKWIKVESARHSAKKKYKYKGNTIVED